MRIPILLALISGLCLGACSAGASGPGSAGVDGGAPADGSGGGASVLWPITSDHSWTYAGAGCSEPWTQKVLREMEMDGKHAFEMSALCGSSLTTWLARGEGDQIYEDYGGWNDALDGTVVDGHQWQFYNSTYEWRQAGTVTVPAGTFSDCWTAHGSYTDSVYCRGIGPVRVVGGSIDLSLVSKSF